MQPNTIGNVLNTIMGNKTIYYSGSPGLFTGVLRSIDEWNLIDRINQPCSLLVTDSPIDYSQQKDNISLQYQINDIAIFHNIAPTMLKKEDKYILRNKLINTHKIFFNEKIKSSWDIIDENYSIINYGYHVSYDGLHSKDILILNFNNVPAINTIYQTLKQNINLNVGLINTHLSYNDLINEISSYKVIISNGSSYESVACAALGCYVISVESNHIDNNILNISYINNFHEILAKAQDAVQKYDSMYRLINDSQQYILLSYSNISNMQSVFNQIFQLISQRAFIYDPQY